MKTLNRKAQQQSSGASSERRRSFSRKARRSHETPLQKLSRLLPLLLFVAVACTAHAQSLSINWSKIAGGGGTSTGGSFAVSGTVGQPDAGGLLTNTQYSIRGGFWVLPQAVPTLGAPTLTIVPAGPGQATLSWSPATPGFILQETPSLISPNWTDSPTGAANPVTVPAVPPAKFYRLVKR
jgi:hypothetical protein